LRRASRRGNELIAVAARRAPARRANFICECSDEGCRDPVPLTVLEYDASREVDGNLIARGHARTGETVIRSTGRYEIVDGG
jgi:hypothetical protein